MRSIRLFTLPVVLALILICSGFLYQGKQAKKGMSEKGSKMAQPIVSPDDIKWAPAPDALPPGAQLAVLDGNPMGKGNYTLRLKLPANYMIPAHWHPTVENVTIVSGSFHVGMGDMLDKTKGMELKAGGFGSMPAKMNHYAWTDAETVVQIHGVGPFAITYVNKADDPRNMTKK